ncbi:hypothetical protein QQ045_006754 [Rhodiola kirilowii]
MGVNDGTMLVVLLVGLNMLLVVECRRDYITWDDLKVDVDKPGWKEVKQSSSSSSKLLTGSSSVIVVDQNGGGDSVSVQGAVDLVPDNNSERVKIFILPGIYREKVFVPKSKPYISFIGSEDKISETVISWNNKAGDKDENGQERGTAGSASVTIESDYFCATGITFENTVVAVPGGYNMQAVALRVAGDKAVFYKVHIIGTQDTLLDEVGTHYYYHSFIQGRVDFICGNAKSLFKECVLHSTAEGTGAIAAHHRNSADEDTGFSFVNCVIEGKGKVFLGRAWGNYSRTIYSHCYINDIITPSGWSDWNSPDRQRTADFGEYKCRGRGADRSRRAPWSRSLSYDAAKPFLNTNYINRENWLQL